MGSTYWNVVKYNFNLNNVNSVWLDCFRQWFILLMTLFLMYYITYAIREIRKAQMKFDFDSMILSIELIKVSSFFLFFV